MADRMRFALIHDRVVSARAKFAEAGFPLQGDSGAIEKDGYRIGYSLTDGALLLEVLAKSRFVPMMAVKVKIRSMLAGEGISEVG